MSCHVVALDDCYDIMGVRNITKGEVYQYLNHRTSDKDAYYIFGDNGRYWWFQYDLFRNIKQHRNVILGKLLFE
jgi:hypothetical protein